MNYCMQTNGKIGKDNNVAKLMGRKINGVYTYQQNGKKKKLKAKYHLSSPHFHPVYLLQYNCWSYTPCEKKNTVPTYPPSKLAHHGH